MSQHIIVGVDGTEGAAAAADRAAEIATAVGATLHVLAVVDESWGKGPKDLHGRSLSPGEHAETVATQVAARIGERHAEVVSGIVHGRAADALVAEAERLGASIIVVGNRRVQGVTRILGSVATHVLQHAPCDVLVVKTH